MIRGLAVGEVDYTLTCYAAGLGEACYEELKLPGKFNRDHFAKTWRMLLESGVGIWLMDFPSKRGAIGGATYEDIFTGEKVASEIFWYIKPEERGTALGLNLMRAFIREARTRGCTIVRSAVPRHPEMARIIGNIYPRLDFTFLESGWEKRL